MQYTTVKALGAYFHREKKNTTRWWTHITEQGDSDKLGSVWIILLPFSGHAPFAEFLVNIQVLL